MSALLIIFGLLFSSLTLFAQDDSLYSFEVEEFTKKTWEWKSELTVAGASKTFNQDSVLYPFKFQQDQQTKAQDLSLQIPLESRWDWEWSRLYFVGEFRITGSSLSETIEQTAVLQEAYWQLSTLDPHSIESGKRLLRWGKGYAFNPVALLERSKDPENPEAAREGLWMVQGLLIPGTFSGLDSNSLTLVYLPVRSGINGDYQANLEQEDIWGLKLSALLGTTDFDLYLTLE